MDRQILNFTANEQTLIVENPIRISTNKVNYIEAHFALGTNWSGYDSVRAVWFTDYQTISTVLDAQGVTFVPFEVMKRKGNVKVDLVGSISEGDVLTDRLTSYPVVAVIVDCVAPITGAETSPITPSQFEQFVANVRADADRAEAGATSAETSAGESEASATASAQSATASANSASQAQTYAQNAQNYAASAETAKDDAIDAKEDAESAKADAESARDQILGMRATANTLAEGSDATASYSDGVLTLGIPRGNTGAKGDKGDKGDTGATPNLSIGTVETLPPTGQSQVTITGTAENPVLNFKLVKGDTGEVSQAEFDEAVSDLKADLSDIGEIVGIRNVNFTEIDGSFITANGGISDSPTFSRSAPVSVSKGDVVKFNARGYNTSVAMISLVNDDGTNIRPQAISVDSTVRLYTYTVAIDGYIAVSYNKNYEHRLTIENDRIGALEDTVETIMITEEVTPSNLRNGYIHRDGRFLEASNFRCTYPIRLENETITFTARGYLNTVSLLCLCDVNGENRINLVNSTEENPQQTVTYTSDGVSYIIISSSLSVPIKYTTKKINQPIDVPYVSLSMFEHFGVVGDSYASGALFFNNAEKDDYAHSWGQIMARSLGTSCTNYSKGGLTTRTWLTDAKGLPLVLSSNPEDIYYLALGINDYYSLGINYLGSITDITSHESYSDYSDTFYGNYGRIIEQILEHAPHAKIVMFTLAAETQTANSFTGAIIEIANHYGLPYVEQKDDPFIKSVFFNGNKVKGHPIAIGYSGMACAFERLLCDCIKNNVAYFKNTFWY